MNVVSLNEWLGRGLHAAGWEAKDIQKAKNSPLLILSELNEPVTEEDIEAIKMIDEDGAMRTPFPLFRYWIEGHGNVLFGCVRREPGRLSVFSFHKQSDRMGPACWCGDYAGNPFGGKATFSNTKAFSVPDFSDITERYLLKTNTIDFDPDSVGDADVLRGLSNPEKHALIRKIKSKIREDEEHISDLKSRVGFIHGVLEPKSKAYQGLVPEDASPEYVWLAVHGVIMRACYEYLAPYNFAAVVSPDRPNKSVEWLRAREHYTVIHRKHPANNSNFVSGARIETEHGLSRLAHSRRAHTRLLQSAKYKNKRGQRVFIKATWVGPREWSDTAGQIYRIADLRTS